MYVKLEWIITNFNIAVLYDTISITNVVNTDQHVQWVCVEAVCF